MIRKCTLLLCALCAVVAYAGSGLYVRGGVNSWGTPAEWEFTETGEGVYTLENKTLFGEFKVADASWGIYNYGGQGVPELGKQYALQNGGGNINMGDKIYECSKITLTIDGTGNATLLLEGNEKETGELTCVYVIGDNTGWDFNNPSGKLEQTSEKGVFEGQVTMVAASGETFCFWRIYEGLGGLGSWGTVDGNNMTESTLSGTLKKGSEGCITTEPGTYSVRFDINNATFALTPVTDSVDGLEGEAVSIVGGEGEIRVVGASDVAVYTIGGALVSCETVATVPSGLYVVKADGQVVKVMVK